MKSVDFKSKISYLIFVFPNINAPITPSHAKSRFWLKVLKFFAEKNHAYLSYISEKEISLAVKCI